LAPAGLTFSPVKGADGNVEYLLYCRKNGVLANAVTEDVIAEVVAASHEM
jgi:23S rRNA (cytidine1920-2'-O)/16S rRNA (cytidine1409-2'-O)-methyltransferase